MVEFLDYKSELTSNKIREITRTTSRTIYKILNVRYLDTKERRKEYLIIQFFLPLLEVKESYQY